jgi:hypothetical protein
MYAWYTTYTRNLSSHREPSIQEEGEFPDLGTGWLEIAVELAVIVYVEMSLKLNRISDVHSLTAPGQFIPFFLALAQLLGAFYRVGKYALIQSIEDDYIDEGKFLIFLACEMAT